MKRQLAYAYRGARAGRPVRGVVYAGGAPQARARLRRMGVAQGAVRLAPLASLRAWLAPRFDPLDLEHVYTFAARVGERGLPRAQMLADAAEFAQDERLRFALLRVRDAVREGAPLARAMQRAGFPERDCELAAAGEDSGRLPQVLAALAREVRREAELARALARVAWSPLIVAASAYVLVYLALVLLAPVMAAKFAQHDTVLRLPPAVLAYYDFVAAFNAHLALSTAAYLAAGAAVALGARAAWTRGAADRLLPALRQVVELSDMAQLWGAFALMTDSGIDKFRIAQSLARAARRPRTRERFRRLERQLKLGTALDVAVQRAGFPRYVVSGVRAAVAGQAIAEGVRELAERLTVQAALATVRVQAGFTGLAAVVGAALVLGFAALTVLPQMAGVLSGF